MKKKTKTKAEQEHLAKVAAMPCCVCGLEPVECHHIRAGQGLGMKATHFETIPLCPNHHRLGGYGVAIHAGQETWEAKFGTEVALLAKVLGGICSEATLSDG